jgi:hypothetical protein
MSLHLYDGVAALKLMYDPALRKAKGEPHIDTLRAHLGNALVTAQEGDVICAASDVEAAATEARKLARRLTQTAKRMRDAESLDVDLGEVLR